MRTMCPGAKVLLSPWLAPAVGKNVLPLGKLKAHGEKAAPFGVGPAAPVGNDLWRGGGN